ncbi:zinc finger protein 271-like isoform X2 [Hoplias malabaricus]|uniref:zinc finger protein 271-like isoform X2 n=1 Tax=Hoplias malabaricus TaxID=27720 RepID=UPI003462B19A
MKMMEAVNANVGSCSEFDAELRTLVEGLLKDICSLAARWSSAVQREITSCRRENQELRHTLSLMEKKFSQSQRDTPVYTPSSPPPPGGDHQGPESSHECDKKTGKDIAPECTDPKRDQCRRIKEEEVEISVTERAQHRLEECSDVLDATPHPDSEVHCQHLELKTEFKSTAKHEIPIPVSEICGDESEDDSQDCLVVDEQHETEDQSTKCFLRLSPPKREEKEEYDCERDKQQEQLDTSYLLKPDLQLNYTPLLNNPGSTSSDRSMFVILDGNADMSCTDFNIQHSALEGRASGISKSTKKKGPRFICSICGKSLSSKYSLTVHLTMHTGDRPYACSQCGKRFMNRTNLQIHQNIHTGAKPYVCTLCPKTFADPSPFGRHKRMHSRELQQSSHIPKYKKILDNSRKDSATSKRGQWRVMLQKLNPVLTGANAEVKDGTITERKEENLEATYGDSLYTPVGLHAEVDNPFYDHKTESEKALPKATTLQSSEPCPDINDDCEDVFEEPAMEDEENETENHLQIPQPKREEEDEFDITLLSPDLQLNSTQLLRETQPESTLSDYTVPFKLDKDLSGTAPMVHHFYKRPLPNDKQIGGTFICDICGKSLTTKGSFICHLRVHSGERPFTCTQCGKRFAKKFNLHIHYNIHSGARPYACALCPKSFADPSALGRHKVTHNMAPGQTVQSKTSQWVKSKKHTAEKRYIVQKTSFRNLH